ncbi:MAG: hypothetical protein IPJ25_15530 [Rhodocyclaceae bacterium]|nr:hypothetical protein [Rhodocyclaceae bacterium]
MKKILVKNWKCFLIAVIFGSLTACAMGGNVFHYSISFDARRDSPEIEVIDYRYSNGDVLILYPEKERLRLGQVFHRADIYGELPRGDFLYVKWRVKATGEIFEDKVDLQKRLPADMEKLDINFVVHGPHLYVFVEWPWDGQPWQSEPNATKYTPVPGGVKRYQGHKQVQIYPDQPKQ